MDSELRRLIRLNEKKRQYYNGKEPYFIKDEFSVLEIVRDEPTEIINLDPISHSRGKAKRSGGWIRN